jgi:hypothetical protein
MNGSSTHKIDKKLIAVGVANLFIFGFFIFVNFFQPELVFEDCGVRFNSSLIDSLRRIDSLRIVALETENLNLKKRLQEECIEKCPPCPQNPIPTNGQGSVTIADLRAKLTQCEREKKLPKMVGFLLNNTTSIDVEKLMRKSEELAKFQIQIYVESNRANFNSEIRNSNRIIEL